MAIGLALLATAHALGDAARLGVSESLALAFFACLAVATPFAHDAVKRRHAGLVLAAVGLLFLARASLLTSDSPLRAWMPLADLLIAYRLPALIARAPSPALEQRWLALDHRWLGKDLLRQSERMPGLLRRPLELCYLLCYPMVPLGFAILSLCGFRGDADRFWTAVLAAALPCYGLVIWLPMRPPRIVERSACTHSRTRALNLRILQHASIQLNTFPSAHVAAAVASALAVSERLPAAGAALGVIAAGIAIGCVVRRYHYAVDAVAGLLLGVIGFLVSRAI